MLLMVNPSKVRTKETCQICGDHFDADHVLVCFRDENGEGDGYVCPECMKAGPEDLALRAAKHSDAVQQLAAEAKAGEITLPSFQEYREQCEAAEARRVREYDADGGSTCTGHKLDQAPAVDDCADLSCPRCGNHNSHASWCQSKDGRPVIPGTHIPLDKLHLALWPLTMVLEPFIGRYGFRFASLHGARLAEMTLPYYVFDPAAAAAFSALPEDDQISLISEWCGQRTSLLERNAETKPTSDIPF